MTEPNIVYIGDEVAEAPYNDNAIPISGIVVSRDQFGRIYYVAVDGVVDFKMPEDLFTPDGRPVDGFGGARIEDRSNQWSIRGCFVSIGRVGAAVDVACRLYGEWVREPTEADLKRRGLL